MQLNVDQPGFHRLVLEDLVVSGEREVGRAHVTALADGQVTRFEVASFIRVEDGLIRQMTEVWTDVADHPTRVAPGSDESALTVRSA